MSDIERAKTVFKDGHSCVFVKGELTRTSDERGIAPLVSLAEKDEWRGFSAADKIVGKAAALIYVWLQAKEVYAQVLSSEAERVFSKHGIKFSFKVKTEKIINRKGDGLCPMESAVADIEDPALALAALKQKLGK